MRDMWDGRVGDDGQVVARYRPGHAVLLAPVHARFDPRTVIVSAARWFADARTDDGSPVSAADRCVEDRFATPFWARGMWAVWSADVPLRLLSGDGKPDGFPKLGRDELLHVEFTGDPVDVPCPVRGNGGVPDLMTMTYGLVRVDSRDRPVAPGAFGFLAQADLLGQHEATHVCLLGDRSVEGLVEHAVHMRSSAMAAVARRVVAFPEWLDALHACDLLGELLSGRDPPDWAGLRSSLPRAVARVREAAHRSVGRTTLLSTLYRVGADPRDWLTGPAGRSGAVLETCRALCRSGGRPDLVPGSDAVAVRVEPRADRVGGVWGAVVDLLGEARAVHVTHGSAWYAADAVTMHLVERDDEAFLVMWTTGR